MGKGKKICETFKVEDALKHPNWSMGRKITIDSSTMVNKGLEVIEAKWLFDVEIDEIQVVVQPQSVIHSMVEYEDGSVIAQLGTPDMKLPIQYALYYPERRYLAGRSAEISGVLLTWTLRKPDMDTFYGLSLAYEAGRTGGSLPTVFNAANELAVAMFLNREITLPGNRGDHRGLYAGTSQYRSPRPWKRSLRQNRQLMNEFAAGGKTGFGNYSCNYHIRIYRLYP